MIYKNKKTCLAHTLSLFLSSKRRKNDELKSKKDDEIEDGETVNNEPTKRVPLSLEEMIEKNKKEQEAIAKPKFLTKEERQAEALRKRQEEAEAIRKRNDELRRKHAQMNKEAELAAAKDEREHERRDRDRGDRHRRDRDDPNNRPSTSNADGEREEAAVKERYLGIIKVKI